MWTVLLRGGGGGGGVPGRRGGLPSVCLFVCLFPLSVSLSLFLSLGICVCVCVNGCQWMSVNVCVETRRRGKKGRKKNKGRMVVVQTVPCVDVPMVIDAGEYIYIYR